MRPERCATTRFHFYVDRNVYYGGDVDLRVEYRFSTGAIPSDLGVSVSPPTIGSGQFGEGTVSVTRGDDPEFDAPVPLKVVASNGGVERTLPFDVVRAAPRLTSFSPTGLTTPQGLFAGTGVTVAGDGLCPGAQVRFGNDQATVPATVNPSPTAEDPNRVSAGAATPRLATSGAIAVVNPSGTVISGAGVLPDAIVASYRNRFGFNFENEDGDWDDVNEDGTVDERDEPKPVGAGSLRDWQELLGPRQTNLTACDIGLFFPGCWDVVTPIPTPQQGLMQTILGESAFYHRGGTCVGLAVASRRIAAGQVTVHGRPPGPAPAAAPVWSLQRTGRETIPGRGDIPLEGRAEYSPIKYAAIQHPIQMTAEFIQLWVARRSLNAVTGPGTMRAALERELRAGRRPMLVISWDGSGHAVDVYDIEGRSDGGFFIRVYDNNYPFQPAENGNGLFHQSLDQNLSRIEVSPGGGWTMPGISVPAGKNDAGEEIRGPRSGPTGDLSWFSVEKELPVVPGSLASLEGLRALATPGLNSTASASASSPTAASVSAEVKSGVMSLGYPDGDGSVIAADSGKAHSIPLPTNSKGNIDAGVFGEGASAEIHADGPGAKASARRGGGNTALLPKGSTQGIGFKAGSGSTDVDLTVISDKSGHLVRVSGARGGRTQLKLAGKGDAVKLTHAGPASNVTVELASYGKRDVAARLKTKLRLGSGARVTLAPRWKRLGRSLPARVNGRRRVLRNHLRPQVRVKQIRVSAKTKGKRVLARVRARLAGRVGKLDALVVGVEVRRGRKVVGQASKQLPPGRRSARRLARGIVIPTKLKSAGGRLTVEAVISATVADPLPSGSSRSAGGRVR